jgi:signal transduction histidine kinase
VWGDARTPGRAPQGPIRLGGRDLDLRLGELETWCTKDLDVLTEELYNKAKALADRDWRLSDRGAGRLQADRQRLTQAVMQLAQNAAQHTRDGDRISLGSAIGNRHADVGTAIGKVEKNLSMALDRGGRERASRPGSISRHFEDSTVIEPIHHIHGRYEVVADDIVSLPVVLIIRAVDVETSFKNHWIRIGGVSLGKNRVRLQGGSEDGEGRDDQQGLKA